MKRTNFIPSISFSLLLMSWAIPAFVAVALLLVQTLTNKFGSNVIWVWIWSALVFVPTLVVLLWQQNKNGSSLPASRIRASFFISLFYLLFVFVIVFFHPVILSLSDISLQQLLIRSAVPIACCQLLVIYLILVPGGKADLDNKQAEASSSQPKQRDWVGAFVAPEVSSPAGKNYLLIIGIDEYRNGIPTLNNAVRDALAFRDLLWEQYDFHPDQTITILNEAATRSKLIETSYELIESLTDQDNLVFYFSGHGELHRTTGRGFWIPADATLGDTSSYLNNLEVTDFLKNLQARHVLGIVDSCFSAALFSQRSLVEAPPRQYAIPSRWLLTAGRIEPVSDGSLGEHSPFATSLLAQLKHNAGKGLWVSELCASVLRGVAFNSDRQLPRGEPLQNVGHQGGEFVFFPKEEK